MVRKVSPGERAKAARHYHDSKTLLMEGRGREALEKIEESINLVPGNNDYLTHKAGILQAMGEYGKAEETLRPVVESGRAPADAHIILGHIAYREGRDQKAVEHLSKASEMEPDDPFIHSTLAHAYTRLGKEGKAAHHSEISKKMFGRGLREE